MSNGAASITLVVRIAMINRKATLMATKKTSKQVNAASPLFLVGVYDAAKAQGSTSSSMVAFLKSGKVVWTNKASVEPVRNAFMQGGMAGRLGVDRKSAVSILALKGWTKDGANDDKRRTLTQQAAYRATITAWSYCARAAGMPNAVTGGKRKPRAPVAPVIVADAKSTAPVVLERIVVPQATTFRDVQTFARGMAALMFKFEQKNAKASFGEYRMIFDTYRSQISALAKAETKVNALKPGPAAKVQEAAE